MFFNKKYSSKVSCPVHIFSVEILFGRGDECTCFVFQCQDQERG